MSEHYEPNPYAAPAPIPATPVDGDPRPPYWNPQHWEPTEVVAAAWARFKQDWAVLIGSLLLCAVVVMVPSGLLTLALFGGLPPPLWTPQGGFDLVPELLLKRAVINVFNIALAQLMIAGLISVYVASARGERPDLSRFFNGMSRFVPLLFTALLVGLIVFGGLILFVVPGLILAMGLWLSVYFAVDRGMGPVEAIEASWRATKGEKARLFVLLLMQSLMALAGMIACCVGVIVALPVAYLATAIVYERLSAARAPPDIVQPIVR